MPSAAFADLHKPPVLPRLSWNVVLAAILALAFYLHSVFWWTEPRDMPLFQGPSV